MAVETNVAYDAAYVKTFSEKRQEPVWLTDLRVKALELSTQLALPKPEKTTITKWNFTQFEYGSDESTVSSVEELPEDVRELIDSDHDDTMLVVQRNNETVLTQVAEQLQAKGVIFTDMKTAAKEHGDLLKKYFMSEAVQVNENKLTALNTAFMQGGLFLYVPKNVDVEVPLQAVYWLENEKVGLFNHVVIVAEENSSVTYVENYLSDNATEEGVANIIAEVYVGANAHVKYGAVDRLGHNITTYVNRRSHVERDGSINWALGQMNDGNTVSENATECLGDGSKADTKIVTISRGDQKQDFYIKVNQHGKHTEGEILARAAVKDTASSIFTGVGKIEHGGSKSVAGQTERVLMLGENARGDANPMLLIDEDDVAADHAASVGQIDPLQLFYMMSRGITRQEAERLIIYGFLDPVVEQLPVEGVKKALVGVIERKVN